jgi:hypothetical protein
LRAAERAVFIEEPVRRVAFLRLLVLRPDVFLALVFRPDVFRPAVLRLLVLRLLVFRPPVLRALDREEDVFFRPDEPLRDRDEEPDREPGVMLPTTRTARRPTSATAPAAVPTTLPTALAAVPIPDVTVSKTPSLESAIVPPERFGDPPATTELCASCER